MESRRRTTGQALLVLSLGLGLGCQSAVDGDDAGASGSGGTGQGGSGGSSGTASGGTSGSASGTGGSAAGTSGTAGQGIGGTAGSSTGGAAGSAAGDAGSGGPAGGGAGGDGATGGSSGSAGASGGTSGAAGAPMTTSGCGTATFPESGNYTMTVDGTEREYIIKLPDAYDPATPYRLVFAFHGRTGTAQQIATGFGGGYYGIEQRLGDDTIFVAPQGLGTDTDPADTGWPNTNGQDIAFVRAMVNDLESSFCIDSTRIFSTGMSYGGIMSDTIACQMSDVFRGIGAIAGAMFGRANCSGPPIAVWMAHGTADDQVMFSQGEAARDAFLGVNHCDTAAEPVAVDPEGCVSYQGCDTGYPVVFCTHDGGHIIPSYSGQAISDFFAQF